MWDSTDVTVQHCHITYTLLILLTLPRHPQNRLSVLLLQQLSMWTCFTLNNKHYTVLRTTDKLIIKSSNISKFWANEGSTIFNGHVGHFLITLITVHFCFHMLSNHNPLLQSHNHHLPVTSWQLTCARSTCKLSLGRLKHYPFMVPQGVSSKWPNNCFTFGTRIKCLVYPAKNQDFRCLSITFHVTGCLWERMFGFLSITMSWQLQLSFGNKGLIHCFLLGRLDTRQEELAAVLTTYAFFTLNP